jgi:hypothetical protein
MDSMGPGRAEPDYTDDERAALDRLSAGSASVINDAYRILLERDTTALEFDMLGDMLKMRAAWLRHQSGMA